LPQRAYCLPEKNSVKYFVSFINQCGHMMQRKRPHA
jgi:hypothetical protein